MTDEEDQRNAELNERIKRCDHRPFYQDGQWKCYDCEARIMIMLLPRKARPKMFLEANIDD